LRTICASVVTVILAAGGPARADAGWGSVFGYVDWTTDYRFFGLSESNRQPAVQGGLHWLGPANFYAGVFISQVDFRDFRNTNIETDFYAGRHFLFDSNDLNVEALYGMYPDSAGHPSYAPPGVIAPTYNFIETSIELAHHFGALTVGGKFVFEPSFDRRKGRIESINGSAGYALTPWLSLSADAGRQWSSVMAERTYWDAGVTARYGWQWTFDLRYYGTDAGRANCYGMNWCAPALVARLTYNVQVL